MENHTTIEVDVRGVMSIVTDCHKSQPLLFCPFSMKIDTLRHSFCDVAICRPSRKNVLVLMKPMPIGSNDVLNVERRR